MYKTGKNFSFDQWHNKEFCVFSSGKLFYKSNRKLFSCVCITWYKHSRAWENSPELWKPETSSRVCITVSNSPTPSSVYLRLCKHGKCFLLLNHKITKIVRALWLAERRVCSTVWVFFRESSFYKSNRKLFSCTCIAWYKYSRGWKNSGQLCKLSTSFRARMTVSNSPNPSRVYIKAMQTQKTFSIAWIEGIRKGFFFC